MLHTLTHSFIHTDVDALQRTVQRGDALLLIQDGVIGATVKSLNLEAVVEKGITVYALREDLDARGLLSHVVEGVTVVDYSGFVDLSEDYYPQMVW